MHDEESFKREVLNATKPGRKGSWQPQPTRARMRPAACRHRPARSRFSHANPCHATNLIKLLIKLVAHVPLLHTAVVVDWFATWCHGCEKSYPEVCKVFRNSDELRKEFKLVKVGKWASANDGARVCPTCGIGLLHRPGKEGKGASRGEDCQLYFSVELRCRGEGWASKVSSCNDCQVVGWGHKCWGRHAWHAGQMDL